jgi:predicted DNA-binding transcriptional regulator AlpA
MESSFSLPETGFVRLPQVLQVFPISKSVWWQGIRDGLYPAPVKLSSRCSAWRVEDIRALIAKKGA